MPRDEKRRQKALARQAARRKERQTSLARAPQPVIARRGVPPAAARWPVEECLITRDWQREGEIVQIIVARSGPDGSIAAGVFLVDLGCLGVKNAFARLFPTRADYAMLRQSTGSRQALVRADLNLVARVIGEAIAYARRFGFNPHRDFAEAAPLLEGADPDASTVHVPLGKDGKPYFIAGPHDNVPRIMAQLTRAVGAGNFEYLVPVSPEFLVAVDDEEDDE